MIADDIADPEPVVRITDLARAKVLRVRAGQPDPDRLALWVEVSGISGGEYTYDMSFPLLDGRRTRRRRPAPRRPVVVIPADSVEKLRGATLDLDGT